MKNEFQIHFDFYYFFKDLLFSFEENLVSSNGPQEVEQLLWSQGKPILAFIVTSPSVSALKKVLAGWVASLFISCHSPEK